MCGLIKKDEKKKSFIILTIGNIVMVMKFKPKFTKVLFEMFLFNLFFTLPLIVLGLVLLMIEEVHIIFSIIIFAVAILVAVPVTILRLGNVKNSIYLIDGDKVTYSRKFISEDQIDIPQVQITNIDYTISWFLDKIFKTGTIKVYTAGTSFTDMNITGIESVVEKYNNISKILDLKSTHPETNESDAANTQSKKNELLKKIKPDQQVAALATSLPLVPLVIITFGIALIFVFWIPLLTHKAYSKKEYYFYTDKLEYYDGFLTINKSTIPNERITDISESRTMVDRIFSTSTIIVKTAGSGGSEVQIKFVKNGSEIIRELREDLKKHGRS